nr:MAG TPA: hypothetical protein [Caudoviricetes sp.]
MYFEDQSLNFQSLQRIIDDQSLFFIVFDNRSLSAFVFQ